ncbi:MAG: tRNA 2-thiouridine(34) synthase MnmA [Planctomycetia bacterium]|nr:tRNA 2-thiouridine(34) synthase MnmA [Planctomycetia bacterium]
MGTTVAVALSGGVDSSVSAAILIRRQYKVFGLFMRHAWQPVVPPSAMPNDFAATVVRSDADGKFSSRPWSPELFPVPQDALAAKRVADVLNIPFFLFDAADHFRHIVDYFTTSFVRGITPNPCALCNRELKFGRLVDAARFLNADLFATGHYVQLVRQKEWRSRQNTEVSCELPAADRASVPTLPDWLADQPDDLPLIQRGHPEKDQSYILFNVERSQLERLCFPLGNQSKTETRELARLWQLPVAERKDSQEVCFAENGRHIDFLEQQTDLPDTTGWFVDAQCKKLGRHKGYHRYTIGQRKGLGIGFGERTFVQRIEPATRNVVLGSYSDLAANVILAERSNWHLTIPREVPVACDVKIRYRNRSTPALITVTQDGKICAQLRTPVFGVAAGQALVAYYGDRLLGGGWITGHEISADP